MTYKARQAFWDVALGNNSKLANLAKLAIDEAEKNPPQRQWVGLTDEEIGDEYVRFEVAKGGFTNFEYATRAIEAKLKEKNT